MRTTLEEIMKINFRDVGSAMFGREDNFVYEVRGNEILIIDEGNPENHKVLVLED